MNPHHLISGNSAPPLDWHLYIFVNLMYWKWCLTCYLKIFLITASPPHLETYQDPILHQPEIRNFRASMLWIWCYICLSVILRPNVKSLKSDSSEWARKSWNRLCKLHRLVPQPFCSAIFNVYPTCYINQGFSSLYHCYIYSCTNTPLL